MPFDLKRLDLRNVRVSYPLIGLALFLPLLWKVYWPVGGGLDIAGYQIGRDFIGVWAGPQIAFAGKVATLFDFHGYWDEISHLFGQRIPEHNWGYPLFTLAAFWPLAQLPYFWALAVWTFGLFGAFAFVVLKEIPAERRGAALLVLALSPACLINTAGGQNGFLSGALLLGGILLIDRRPFLAGLLFGLLTFKPHLGLVLPFVLVALGAWRTIAAAAMTTVLLLGGSVALFGIEPWRQYVACTSIVQLNLLQEFSGYYTYMMTSVLAGARTLGIAYGTALVIQAAASLVVLPVAVLAVMRTSDPCRRAFVVASATLLVTPYAFDYDMTALSACIVWSMFGRTPWHDHWRFAYLAGWAAPLAMIQLNNYGIPIGPPVIASLFVVAVRDALQGQPLLPPVLLRTMQSVRAARLVMPRA